jgi:hypothetical protein
MSRFIHLRFCFLIVVAVSLTTGAYGQKKDAPYVIGYQSGIGGFNLALTAADSITSPRPTLRLVHTVTGDFLIGKRFSLGVMLSGQNVSMSLIDSNESVLERGNIRQVYTGFRGLWHFGNSERLDFYSGFRVGIRFLSARNLETAQGRKSLIKNRFNRSFPSVGFIPIGVRFLFENQLGLHFETSLGAPSLASFGVNYRF